MFFILSKIFWALAQPLNALCLLGLLGAILYRTRWMDAGQRIMNLALTGILVFGLLPIGPLAVGWLERQTPGPEYLPQKVDGIVLLGGAFEPHLSEKNGQIIMNAQASRAVCFLGLARMYPKAKLVFSGGSGDLMNPQARESGAAEAFFKMAGLANRNIVYESNSRNTFENAVYTKELVKPKKDENWILVTSRFHMPRALGIFKQQGWDVLPYGCDPKTDGDRGVFLRAPNVLRNFTDLNITIRELIGSVVYYVTGKSAFILPPPALTSGPS